MGGDSADPAAENPPGDLLLSEPIGYGIVLGLLLAVVAISIVAPAAAWAWVTIAAMQGAAVLAARGTARPRRRIVWPALVALIAGAVILSAVPGRAARIAAGTLDLVLLISLSAIILVRFRSALFVTVQSVLGAVSVYIVVGLVFAVLDPTLGLLSGRPFFAQSAEATPSQYTYFSFITLCTVGYGDLTPGFGLARALAVAEALLGQLYLVTVIALVVANVGHQRQPARASLGDGEGAPGRSR